MTGQVKRRTGQGVKGGVQALRALSRQATLPTSSRVLNLEALRSFPLGIGGGFPPIGARAIGD